MVLKSLKRFLNVIKNVPWSGALLKDSNTGSTAMVPKNFKKSFLMLLKKFLNDGTKKVLQG